MGLMWISIGRVHGSDMGFVGLMLAFQDSDIDSNI